MKPIKVYTDGAYDECLNVGSWGVCILYPDGEIGELSGKEIQDNEKSSQMMELFAIVEGLKYLSNESQNIVIYSDCLSLIDFINDIWFNKNNNKDHWDYKIYRQMQNLFKFLKKLMTKSRILQVKFVHVKGHDGNQWNEKCHSLSTDLLKEARVEVLGEKRYNIIFN